MTSATTTPGVSETLAIAFARFGGPEELYALSRPRPIPRAGEVLVRVAAATVNPTDILMLRGQQAALMSGIAPPYIAGMEFSGHIIGGFTCSDALSSGQAVFGIVDARRPDGGAHAEWVCVPECSVAPIDSSADMSEAATIPMNGMTALMCLEELGIREGGSILVTGGAGCVGGYVIQFAKLAGLCVYADANEQDAALLRQLGADYVVPRGRTMQEAVRSSAPTGVDGVVDAALIGADAAALVRDGGTAVSLRRSNAISDDRLTCRYVSIVAGMSRTSDLGRLAALHCGGELTARIAVRLPMTAAAHAYDLVERGGLRGRVVLLC